MALYSDSDTLYSSSSELYGGSVGNRWWVNADADNDWNNANNWSLTEGGAGGAGVPTSLDNVYFSDTSSPDNCTASASVNYLTLSTRTSETSGTDNWSGTLDWNGQTVTASGKTYLGGVDGSSECVVNLNACTWNLTGIETANINSYVDIQSNSAYTIACTGDWLLQESIFGTTGSTGSQITISGTGNFRNHLVNVAETMIHSASAVHTVLQSSGISSIVSDSTTLNGQFNIGSGIELTCGASIGGTLTLGSGFSIVGAGGFRWLNVNSSTVTNNSAEQTSFSGDFICGTRELSTRTMFPLNAPNANLVFRPVANETGQNTATIEMLAGTFICKDIIIDNNNFDINVVIDNSVNNPDFKIMGDFISIINDAGTSTSTWTKGTGSLYLMGASNQDIYPDDIDGDLELEPLVIDGGGNKQLRGDFKTSNISAGSSTSTSIVADSLGGVYNISAVA